VNLGLMCIYKDDEIFGEVQIFTKSLKGVNPKKCRHTCEKSLKVSESATAKGSCHHVPKSLREK
jgi:hypothetical protein